MGSKKTLAYSITGVLDFDEMTITETTKDDIFVYDFRSILEQFHNKNISLTLKKVEDLEPIED